MAQVLFVLPPGNAVLGKTGVDDYLSRGGTIQELLAVAEATAPDPDADDDSLTDSRLAERVTDEALADSFRWAPGLGWLNSPAGGGKTPQSRGWWRSSAATCGTCSTRRCPQGTADW